MTKGESIRGNFPHSVIFKFYLNPMSKAYPSGKWVPLDTCDKKVSHEHWENRNILAWDTLKRDRFVASGILGEISKTHTGKAILRSRQLVRAVASSQ